MFSTGVWRKRREAAEMTGLRPVFRLRSARGAQAVIGWGFKPTAARARAAAARAGAPYWAMEDGFFRSIDPGEGEAALSFVLDREGIYYDAAGPSALERLVLARAADPERAARDAEPALAALRAGLSKYNRFAGPAAEAEALAALHPDPARNLLLADQTAGDAAVTGALAGTGLTGRAAFRAMLIEAAEAAPEVRLILKTHPETAAGRRSGHFDDALLAEAAAASPAFAGARAAGRVVRLTAPVRPRALFERVGGVRVVSSLLGFEALAAGLPVVCHGRAFYAGWGLTEDRAPPPPRRRPVPFAALAAAAYADYCRWFHPATRAPMEMEAALALLAARAGRI